MTAPGAASFWDRAYRDGDHLEHWEPGHTPQELVAVVAAGLIPAAGTVLDLGCGGGREAIFLAACGFSAIGLDSSRGALAVARSRAAEAGVEVGWCLGSALALPLAAAAVDFVNDRGCLHLFDRERRDRYAAEIHRVLRPGGCFLLRGAARDCDEEGLVAVNRTEVDRFFLPRGFRRGPVVPVTLTAPSASLAGNLVVLTRSPD